MKKIFLSTLLIAAIALQFCTSPKKTQVAPVTPTVPVAPVVVKVNYETDVKSLLVTKCTPCHFPPDGRKEPLNSYASATKNIDDIIARIKQEPGTHGFMPARKPKLSDSVIHVFEQWKADGLLEK